MKQVSAIIERGMDGLYSIYIDDLNFPYGIIGTGESVQDAQNDFMAGYRDMKSYVESTGGAFEDVEFQFKYDIPSFLQEYAYAFSLAGLSRITGINQKQLGHYISGFRRPSNKTVRKMEEGIHAFSSRLKAVRFI